MGVIVLNGIGNNLRSSITKALYIVSSLNMFTLVNTCNQIWFRWSNWLASIFMPPLPIKRCWEIWSDEKYTRGRHWLKHDKKIKSEDTLSVKGCHSKIDFLLKHLNIFYHTISNMFAATDFLIFTLSLFFSCVFVSFKFRILLCCLKMKFLFFFFFKSNSSAF